ncbi:MAG: arsenate reductase [Candidatus Accumulibacter meliphilus]|jgi:arsenate reductase|uniref:Arsenate reductase n=1 Tax=Candidatus Accumulibacter meliphilus TaxID=2211374 RepID=A0A369XP20_9PROT|nr:MAG: arsenate reductase [Candidatus Accumulibacter meliphilus]
MTADPHPTSRRLRIFGIRNCDTMKKAFTWLNDHGLAFDFVDYRQQGISAQQLAAWSQRCDWKLLLNTRGTTWRKLAEEQRRDIDESRALQLMAAHPSLIKRPVIDCGEHLLVGFDRQRYASELMALMEFPESTETE